MKIHIVQKGDSLWKIAQKYNVNFEELKKSNSQLSNPDMIMPGMKIKVPMAGVPVKKEGQVMGVTKEAPIQQVKGVKEAPKVQHPYKEMPKKPAVKEQPIKEAPKTPYVPKMPQLKPYFPEIDVNNYYTVNVPISKQTANIKMPKLPKAPKPKKEIPEKVKGVEAPAPAPTPHMPIEECYPVSPVLPGSGLCPPPCPPMHHGHHGWGPGWGAPGMGMPGMAPGMEMPGMAPGMQEMGMPQGMPMGMGQGEESPDFDYGQMQQQMQQLQQMGQMPQMGQEEYDPTAVAGVQDQMGGQYGMPGMMPQGMPGMMPQGMPGMGMPGMMPQGMPGMGMPGMMPQGMPMGPMGGYPCYPMGPVAPGAGFGPMGGYPQQGQPQQVAGASDGDCGCGPSPQQMGYRDQVPYGFAPYGMHPGYGYPVVPPGYYNPPGYGYGFASDERNEGSDFDGPEYDDES